MLNHVNINHVSFLISTEDSHIYFCSSQRQGQETKLCSKKNEPGHFLPFSAGTGLCVLGAVSTKGTADRYIKGNKNTKKNPSYSDHDDKWEDYIQNKQLQFGSQLQLQQISKMASCKGILIPHIKHKNSYASSMAMHSNRAEFQSRRKKAKKKNTLLLLTPASHFGLQRFRSAWGHVSAVFREMTCLRTNTAMFCSTPAPQHPRSISA